MSRKMQNRNPEWLSDLVLGFHEQIPIFLLLELENVASAYLVCFLRYLKNKINQLNLFQGASLAHWWIAKSSHLNLRLQLDPRWLFKPPKSRLIIALDSFVFLLKIKSRLPFKKWALALHFFLFGYRERAGRFTAQWLKQYSPPHPRIFPHKWIRADRPLQQ